MDVWRKQPTHIVHDNVTHIPAHSTLSASLLQSIVETATDFPTLTDIWEQDLWMERKQRQMKEGEGWGQKGMEPEETL